MHCLIRNLGEVLLGLSNGGPANTFSPPVILPADLGRWIHLAATIDRNSGVVTHYRDGEIVMQSTSAAMPPLVIGNAEIGNWQAQGSGNPIRSLNGRMDEFLILSRVLSPEEVMKIYQAGLPNG